MERFAPLLLDVWREIGRHFEIGETLERIAPLLARRLPIDRILVRRLDLARTGVETAAASPAFELARDALPTGAFQDLAAWCRRGRSARATATALARRLPGLIPVGVDGHVLAGPLPGEDGRAGAFLLVASAAHRFSAEHEAMFRALLEPLTVALENDRRLTELETLRAAAEADRQSLLARLGRHDLQDTVVGVESGLRSSMERIEIVAPSDVPVLLLGETGSGKEVAARAIHVRSRRADGPFLRVNCGAIPTGLIDSELFGHERGSFTGADARRQGWFERADGGTLFLDEVGELPLPAQVRLLRILQDGSFERVGGSRPLHADVRIVAATNRDLHSMVAEGSFREDLWYRLAVFVIHLPPLRERIEDIPALATHFALRAATRFGLPPLTPTRDDATVLATYAWPGNIRELAAVMDRAVLLGQGRALEVGKALGALPSALAPARASGAQRGAIETNAPGAEAPASFDEAVKRHIEAALEKALGRIEGPFGAARALGVNPHTLRARMRKLGVDWRRFRTG